MGKRFVIIGCGRIAHKHAEQANRIGLLVGACDPDQTVLDQFTQQYGISGYTDTAALFHNCQADLAIICSPNFLHITHIKLALEHGLDVLCEKPLCIDVAEAEGLKTVLARSANQVFLVLSARFHQEQIKLKQQISDGELGKLLSFQLNACWNRGNEYYEKSTWKGTLQQDGGILYTQFSHYLDALIWCLGNIQPIAVRRSNRLHGSSIEGEDTGVALLQTQDNCIGTFHWTVNSTGRNMEISLLLIGEKGTKKIGGEYMDVLEYEHIIGQPEPGLQQQELKQPGGHHDKIYDQLALALDNLPNNLPGITEGLAAVNLIAAIYALPQEPVIRQNHG